MKIKSITIEGMHNVSKKTYTFNDINYLCGPNGAGKSTVIQAIQLALLGYIPGTAKKKEAIFKHANGAVLGVTLKLDDAGQDVTVARTWAGLKSNITPAVEITPGYKLEEIVSTLELPIFNFNEFLNLSANALKDWFIDFLPKEETEINWKKELTDSLKEATGAENAELVKNVLDSIECYSETGVELVRKVNEFFKTGLSFKKTELDRAENTIQSLVFHDDIEPDMTIDQVSAKIAQHEAARAAITESFRAAQQNEQIKLKLEALSDCTAESVDKDPMYEEIRNKLDEATAERERLSSSINSLDQDLNGLQIKYNEAIKVVHEYDGAIAAKKGIIESGGICPYTKSCCDSINSLIEEYKKDVEDLNKQRDEANEEVKSILTQRTKVNNLKTANQSGITELDDKIVRYQRKLNEIDYNYRQKALYTSQLVDVPEVEVDGVDHDAEIFRLKDLQVKLAANERYNELIDKLTADKFRIESEIDAYKVWIKLTGVNGLQVDDSSTAAFTNLAEGIDKYIKAVFGSDINSKFNLEAKANSFNFGIERDGKYIPFNLLSSGEKCIYTLALMLNIVEKSESKLNFIIVDDLLDHLDDDNINTMFESLKDASDVQMIFAGVKNVDSEYTIGVKSEQ